jgi:hypothetical protein
MPFTAHLDAVRGWSGRVANGKANHTNVEFLPGTGFYVNTRLELICSTLWRANPADPNEADGYSWYLFVTDDTVGAGNPRVALEHTVKA